MSEKIYLYEMKDVSKINPIMISQPEEILKYSYCDKVVMWDKKSFRKVAHFFESEGCPLLITYISTGYGVDGEKYCELKFTKTKLVNAAGLLKLENYYD